MAMMKVNPDFSNSNPNNPDKIMERSMDDSKTSENWGFRIIPCSEKWGSIVRVKCLYVMGSCRSPFCDVVYRRIKEKEKECSYNVPLIY